MRDASEKGRVQLPAANFASDDTHQVAKLTNEQVAAIRATAHWRRGVRQALAVEFGVTPGAIWLARTGRTFQDVP